MTKVFHPYRSTRFFILFLFLIPCLSLSVMADSYEQILSEISKLDAKIDAAINSKRQARESLDAISRFSMAARPWFIRLNNVKNRITELEKQLHSNEGYGTFDASQLKEELQDRKREQETLMRLDGGSDLGLGGKKFTSMENLQTTFMNNAQTAISLNRQYSEAEEELNRLDVKRDGWSQKLQAGSDARISGYQKKIQSLKEDLQKHQQEVNDPETFYLAVSGSDDVSRAKILDRDSAIAILADRYVKKIKANDMPYDPDALANEIKFHRDISNAIREQVLTVKIPALQQEIDDLYKKVQAEKKGMVVLEGCWAILIGSDDFPTIDISRDSGGLYNGYITYLGQLNFHRKGQRLFFVRATDDKYLFRGTEFAYYENGKPGNNNTLRITVQPDGDFLTYRSDQELSMRRCQ